jgi:hypothetical protein
MDQAGSAELALQQLPEWVDEQYLYRLFAQTQAVIHVKMSRLPIPGSGRVAIMTMNSPASAAGVLQHYSGVTPPNANFHLDITWASQLQLIFQGAQFCAVCCPLCAVPKDQCRRPFPFGKGCSLQARRRA